ncbi:hypothetical protein [Sphaerisporangium siamense]|uniref:Uncharacterized protein n=1 Tax=Sphaerisporangium siamense TaxID=795645 RepID=A0A7W7GB59_9ACTN|nr:hypothetical protein [Sphaerisporangium siamense]MBB4702460.1 hypothetical protein [Sphaerisporangium siamense]
MAELGRALYTEGLTSQEVVHECYGVAFPQEFFVLAEADPRSLELMAHFTRLPWQLAVPLDRGGPHTRPGPLDDIERKVFARDPDLVPLFLGVNTDLTHGGGVRCYSLAELGAGRTTVFGIWKDVEPHNQVTRSGDSLLAVLHEHHTQYVEWLEEDLRLPERMRTRAIDDEIVDEIRELVVLIEEFQRRAAARQDG